ncbi:MAG: helix-turn-helix domain-containing protein [Desulfobacula sp.]|nr:helix-turn-helix domain-containing protein [Desulfobacula sp.]
MSRKKINISELDLNKIGDRIIFLRLKSGLTQDQFAEKTSLTKSNISGLENNKYEPSTRAIIKIVELFNVSSDWILFGDKVKNKKKLDPAFQILNEALEETGVKINEKQKKACLKILREKLEKSENETKEDIKKYLRIFNI